MNSPAARPLRTRTRWVWRWLASLAFASVTAIVAVFSPDLVQAGLQLVHGRGKPGLTTPPANAAGLAVCGFIEGWIVGLLLVAIWMIVEEPRPHW